MCFTANKRCYETWHRQNDSKPSVVVWKVLYIENQRLESIRYSYRWTAGEHKQSLNKVPWGSTCGEGFYVYAKRPSWIYGSSVQTIPFRVRPKDVMAVSTQRTAYGKPNRLLLCSRLVLTQQSIDAAIRRDNDHA